MPKIITVSAPAKRELTSVATDVAATSISPANKACNTIGLALMATISGSTPYFCSNRFSCSTQTAALAGLAPDQAMRIFFLGEGRTDYLQTRYRNDEHCEEIADHGLYLLV